MFAISALKDPPAKGGFLKTLYNQLQNIMNDYGERVLKGFACAMIGRSQIIYDFFSNEAAYTAC